MSERKPDSYYINIVEEDKRNGIFATYTKDFLHNYQQALRNEIKRLKQ